MLSKVTHQPYHTNVKGPTDQRQGRKSTIVSWKETPFSTIRDVSLRACRARGFRDPSRHFTNFRLKQPLAYLAFAITASQRPTISTSRGFPQSNVLPSCRCWAAGWWIYRLSTMDCSEILTADGTGITPPINTPKKMPQTRDVRPGARGRIDFFSSLYCSVFREFPRVVLSRGETRVATLPPQPLAVFHNRHATAA